MQARKMPPRSVRAHGRGELRAETILEEAPLLPPSVEAVALILWSARALPVLSEVLWVTHLCSSYVYWVEECPPKLMPTWNLRI